MLTQELQLPFSATTCILVQVFFHLEGMRVFARPPEKSLSCHFNKKYLHAMQLKLTEYVRITIFLLSQKPSEITILRASFSKIFNFHLKTKHWLF